MIQYLNNMTEYSTHIKTLILVQINSNENRIKGWGSRIIQRQSTLGTGPRMKTKRRSNTDSTHKKPGVLSKGNQFLLVIGHGVLSKGNQFLLVIGPVVLSKGNQFPLVIGTGVLSKGNQFLLVIGLGVLSKGNQFLLVIGLGVLSKGNQFLLVIGPVVLSKGNQFLLVIGPGVLSRGNQFLLVIGPGVLSKGNQFLLVIGPGVLSKGNQFLLVIGEWSLELKKNQTDLSLYKSLRNYLFTAFANYFVDRKYEVNSWIDIGIVLFILSLLSLHCSPLTL